MAARFDTPCGIAVDAVGTVLVADTRNATVRRIAPDGTVTTLAREGLLRRPAALALAHDGVIYVADQGGRIVQIALDGVQHVLADAAADPVPPALPAAPAAAAPTGTATVATPPPTPVARSRRRDGRSARQLRWRKPRPFPRRPRHPRRRRHARAGDPARDGRRSVSELGLRRARRRHEPRAAVVHPHARRPRRRGKALDPRFQLLRTRRASRSACACGAARASPSATRSARSIRWRTCTWSTSRAARGQPADPAVRWACATRCAAYPQHRPVRRSGQRLPAKKGQRLRVARTLGQVSIVIRRLRPDGRQPGAAPPRPVQAGLPAAACGRQPVPATNAAHHAGLRPPAARARSGETAVCGRIQRHHGLRQPVPAALQFNAGRLAVDQSFTVALSRAMTDARLRAAVDRAHAPARGPHGAGTAARFRRRAIRRRRRC
jgi:hypothetical protein